MHKFITVMLLTVAAPSYADSTLDVCASLGEMSQNIMVARQNDIPISRTLSALEDAEEPYKTLATAIIMDAYESPGYSSDLMQDRATRAFRNKWEIICVKIMSDGANT